MTAKKPNRQIWSYGGCYIRPSGIFPGGVYHSTFGRVSAPIDFGDRVRSFWWTIDFPDGSWIRTGTKARARSYIERAKQTQPWRFNPTAKAC